MAKICRVLEKLRQLRTDQLRKSGSVCMLPLLHYQGFNLEPSRCPIGGENIDICFTFEGGGSRHQDQQTPQKQQNKPSVCFTDRFKPVQWAKLDELSNLRSFRPKVWFIFLKVCLARRIISQKSISLGGKVSVTWRSVTLHLPGRRS